MTKSLSVTGLLLIMLSLFSCDCMQHIAGQVVDASSHQPIQGAKFYREKGKEYYRLTDSSGRFEDYTIVNGFTCWPKLILYIEKEGYSPQRIKWKSKTRQDSLIIYLEKGG